MNDDTAFRRELAIKLGMGLVAAVILMSYASGFGKLDTISGYGLLSLPVIALVAALAGSTVVVLTGAANPGRAAIFTRWWCVAGWLAIVFGALAVAAF